MKGCSNNVLTVQGHWSQWGRSRCGKDEEVSVWERRAPRSVMLSGCGQ